MNKIRPFIISALIFFLGIPLLGAQTDNKIDSLMNVLEHVNGQDSIAPLSELAALLVRTDKVKARKVIKELERLAVYYEKPKLNLEVWKQRCLLYSLQFQQDSILITARKGIAGAIKFEDDLSLSYFYSYMGSYHSRFGSVDSSLYYYHLGLKIKGANKRVFYSNLGQSYRIKKNYLKSIEYLELAMDNAKANRNINSEAIVSNNIALVYAEIGVDKKAIEYAERSLELKNQIGDKRGKMFAYITLVQFDLSEERLEKHLLAIASITEELGDPVYNRLLKMVWASLLTKKGETQQALDMLLPIYAEAKESQTFELLGILDNLIETYIALDRLTDAKKHALEALNLASKLNDIQWAQAYLLQIYSKENSYQEYHAIAKEYYPIQDSIKNQQSLNRLAFLNAKIEDTEQKQEIVLLNQSIRQKEIRRYWFLTAIGLGAAILLLILYFRNRVIQVQRAQLQKEKETAHELSQMNEKLQSLDGMKSRFFTNISHEFRTPLTIISGMIELVKTKPDLWLEKGSQMIKENTLSLLNLVNQILDLRKLESKNLEANLVQGDIIQYLRYLTTSFQPYAENKGLQLHFLSAQASLQMDYDADKMLRIISNLLSNAVKYTLTGGHIYFHIDQKNENEKNYLQIQVQDTGAGIARDQLPNIFDRFYQADDSTSRKGEGTGIGLTLVKELVHLANGEITVNSELGVGTTFLIKFPITTNSPVQNIPIDLPENLEVIAGNNPQQVVQKEALTQNPILLIVEDNPDIVQFLVACLENHYQLQFASNGQEGIDKAIEQVPDLIVSDVMMPKKDGFELCQTLKQDESTSHIPIVLLTAKADLDSKISGLEKGADAYLTKPFEPRELLVRLKKLLELRQSLQERYFHFETHKTSADTEDAFLLKVQKILHNNLDDENFGIVHLCRALAMSRTQVHRKIKALTGKSSSLFIRSIRLQKGRELLQTTDLSISEVAYQVGFKHPSHFSGFYSEEFGEAPSETRK